MKINFKLIEFLTHRSHYISLAFLLFFLTTSSYSVQNPSIGKIFSLEHREDHPIMIEQDSKRHAACKDCPVFEGDRISCKKNQTLTIELNDGSLLTIAQESALVIESWTQRSKEGFLRRVIYLSHGVLRAIINKVYSEKEPFLIKTKSAVMGVRGTEFIVTINEERLQNREREQTVSLYTIKGDVHFAKSEGDFLNGNFVRTLAGYHSIISSGMNQPTTPKQFELPKLNETIKDRLPKNTPIEIQKEGKYEVLDVRTKIVTGNPNSTDENQMVQTKNHGLGKPPVLGEKLLNAKTPEEKQAIIEKQDYRSLKEKPNSLDQIHDDVEKNKTHDRLQEQRELNEKEKQFQSPLKDLAVTPMTSGDIMLERTQRLQNLQTIQRQIQPRTQNTGTGGLAPQPGTAPIAPNKHLEKPILQR